LVTSRETALPGRAEDLGDGGLQSLMSIGDHQLDAAQAAPGEGAQELDPKRLGLAVADRHAQHLAPAVVVDANSNDDSNRDDAVVAPRQPSHFNKARRLGGRSPR